jgi:hypothetical protein
VKFLPAKVVVKLQEVKLMEAIHLKVGVKLQEVKMMEAIHLKLGVKMQEVIMNLTIMNPEIDEHLHLVSFHLELILYHIQPFLLV